MAGEGRYDWSFYGSPDGHRAMRQASAEVFGHDLLVNPGRYVPASLPDLPFRVRQFDLVLCSHLLFTYADRLDAAFHLLALLEMRRVCSGEVRVFPLLDQAGRPQDDLVTQLTTDLAEGGVRAEVREVPYEFQRGGNRMLVLLPTEVLAASAT